MKKRFPFYLLLLPLFSLFHGYNDLFGFFPVGQMAFYLLLSYGLAAVTYLVAYLFIRRPAVAALISFCVLLFTLFFGPYHDFLKSVSSEGLISSYKVILPVSILLLALIVYAFAKKSVALDKFSRYLNTLMIVLLVLESGKALLRLPQTIKTNNLIYSATPVNDQYKSATLPDSAKPDIYFMVLDEYTSNAALQDIWHFNNDSITNWLSAKGFYVVSNSRANYDFTPFSISSTLNMNYIRPNEDTFGITSQQILQSVRSLSNNETFTLLQKEGYEMHFFAPFNSPLEHYSLLHEFGDYSLKKLYNHTLPMRVRRDILWNFLSAGKDAEPDRFTYNNFGKRVEDTKVTISNTEQAADANPNRKPRFVYTHLMITHKPHLFNADGTLRPSQEILASDNLQPTYTQQVIYANKVIQELVSHIQQNNKKNTVIIIEGDHGFRDLPDPTNRHRFSNFNAIYFADGHYAQLYKDMSPVNTFRAVFNNYFHQHLPLLKDSTVTIKFKP
jgi:hypothetical protein